MVLGLDMWMRRLRSMGVATTTASAGTASMVLARSSTCVGNTLQQDNTRGMGKVAGSAETFRSLQV